MMIHHGWHKRKFSSFCRTQKSCIAMWTPGFIVRNPGWRKLNFCKQTASAGQKLLVHVWMKSRGWVSF